MKPRSVLAREPNRPLEIEEVDLGGLNAGLRLIGPETCARAVPPATGRTTHHRIDAAFDPQDAGGARRPVVYDRPQACMFTNSLPGKVIMRFARVQNVVRFRAVAKLPSLCPSATVDAVEICVHAACETAGTALKGVRDMLARVMAVVMRSPPIALSGQIRFLLVTDLAADHLVDEQAR